MPAKISQEDENKIIEAYLNGATAEEASSLFGYSKPTCFNVLRRRGIKSRSLSESLQHPKAPQEAMIQAYLDGATLEEAGALFGYSKSACSRSLTRKGILKRGLSEAGRHYKLDEKFFDEVKTEKQAYWLGFITADGAFTV